MRRFASLMLLLLAICSTTNAQSKPQVRFPGPTREAALGCPGAGCIGSVTASPGEEVEFWVAGNNLASATGIKFQPAEGIEVSTVESTNETVRAVLKISATAALGKRTFIVTSPGGDSNQSSGELNISTFRISNLKIDNVENNSGTLTFRVTFNYTDPTGAVSSDGLNLYSSLRFAGQVISGVGSGYSFKPEGPKAGAKAGVMSLVRSYEDMRGTSGAIFSISLAAKDGRESDTLRAIF